MRQDSGVRGLPGFGPRARFERALRQVLGFWDCTELEAEPGLGDAEARTIAPTPATMLNATAINCVSRRPHAGTSVKSVRKHPTAAPAVFTAYSSAMRRACDSTSVRTRWRISSVSVPPMSSVIGISSASAIPARAAYDAGVITYQPLASCAYDVTSTERRSRCGSTNEIASPSAAMAASKYPYARSSESGLAAYRRSDQAPAA